MLFGKVLKDKFNLDVGYPFTIIQSAALAVSSFEKKLGCEWTSDDSSIWFWI